MDAGDVGVQVGAIVGAEDSGGLFEAADNMVHSDSQARLYIEGGALAKKLLLDHHVGTGEDVVSTEDRYVRGFVESGLALSLTLESSDEIQEGHSPVETKGRKLVGIVLDPETILVPHNPDSSDSHLYEVIDPNHGRFEPIMNLLGEVNQMHGNATGAAAGETAQVS